MAKFEFTAIKPVEIVGDRSESGAVADSTTRTCTGTLVRDGLIERVDAGTEVAEPFGATILATALTSGVVRYDCSGGNSNATFDSAANLQSELGLDAAFQVAGPFFVANSSDAAENATLVQGTGNTLVTSGGDAVLTQGEFAIIFVMATNVTESSEANVILALKA